MFVVVFHHQYFSASDNGHRVYRADDPYLDQFPSMYRRVASFDSEEEARAYCSRQPFAES